MSEVTTYRPDIGYFRNAQNGKLSLPIRFEPPIGPRWLAPILRAVCGDTAIYRYHADEANPLTLVLADGTEYQPNRTFETDMGSIPLLLQAIPGGWYQKDRLLPAYILHDDGYGHGGLFVRRPGATEFTFEPMGKDKIDALLYVGALILGAPRKHAARIYWAVDRFGGGVWADRSPARVAWKVRKGFVAA